MKIKYWSPLIYDRQKGRSLIVWIVLTPFMLLGLAIALLILGVLLCETNKAYWDYKVKKMCAEDGGVAIFEYIEVTAEEFESMPRTGSNISIQNKKPALSSGAIVFSEYKSIDIHLRPILGFNPSLYRIWRSKTLIKRSRDEKIIAQTTSYSRMGGDFPSPSHGSSFSCPPTSENRLEREHIFIVTGK